jgi:hypothetical protein
MKRDARKPSSSENLTVRPRAALRSIGSSQEQRSLIAGLSFALGAPCVVIEGNLCLHCAFTLHGAYDEDGIYLDS